MICRHWQPGYAFPAHVASRRERGEAGGAAFRMSLPLAIRRPLGGMENCRLSFWISIRRMPWRAFSARVSSSSPENRCQATSSRVTPSPSSAKSLPKADAGV